MPDYLSLDVRLRIGASRLHIQVQIPEGPMSLLEFLPVAQSLTDGVVAAGVREAVQAGRPVSCGPGCGACCRQLVPVSEIEALYLRDMLSRLDSSHRRRIEERFETAVHRLSDAGLLDKLHAADALDSGEARRELGYSYFRLGIPCPFLDNESCSIHPQRPISCREYLVTSPPKRCAHPQKPGWETVELPRRPSIVLFRFGDGVGASRPRWSPLTLMLEPARSFDARLREHSFSGPALFERFVRELADEGDEETASPETEKA